MGTYLLTLGFTFKENFPDVRNNKIVDIIAVLADYGVLITIYDPWLNPEGVVREFQLHITTKMLIEKFDAFVLSVAHEDFK